MKYYSIKSYLHESLIYCCCKYDNVFLEGWLLFLCAIKSINKIRTHYVSSNSRLQSQKHWPLFKQAKKVNTCHGERVRNSKKSKQVHVTRVRNSNQRSKFKSPARIGARRSVQPRFNRSHPTLAGPALLPPIALAPKIIP